MITCAGSFAGLGGQVRRLDMQHPPARQLLRELSREEELPYLHPNFMSESLQTSSKTSEGRLKILLSAWLNLRISHPDVHTPEV